MEYDLSRIDYTICGITYPDTLKALPPSGQKPEQKFAIGDKNGVLQCLTIKDEEPVVHFKTLPGKPITSVQVTSALGTQADNIFTASGNEVKGYTRKGKVFLTIETSLSETITSMCIMGSDLILCSGRTITFYRDLREYHSYACEDRVLDIAPFAAPNSTRVRLLVLIANKGAVILENGNLVARTVIGSGPSRLAVPPITQTMDIYALYGAVDGSIGLIAFEESILSSKCLMEGRGLGSVVCLGWFFSNGNTHLCVGRHDGSIQLYTLDMDNLGEKPHLKYTYFSGEPVTSVAGGCIGTQEPEILVATFSGRVFALRPSHLVLGAKIPQEILTARRTKLEVEIARLEKQTANEREKYQRNTRSIHSTGLSTPPLLDIQFELSGATRDGWQEARFMSAVPLDMLFIYCDRKIDMQTDTAAVLSVCTSQEKSDLLATVRCQAGTRRVWIRMRYTTGTSPEARMRGRRVLIYTLPAGAPRVARLVTLNLPAMPYYSQHVDLDDDRDKLSRSWCQLQVSGSFSVAEITSWLSEALPGELPRPAANVSFVRSHTLLGTLLICQYQRSQAIFKSDNVSTIAVVRNIVSNYSVEKNIRVELSCDVPDDCCLRAFINLESQFTLEYRKNKDILMKKAISMLDLVNSINDEGPVLCQDYARLWDSGNISETQFTELVDTVVQWYLDKQTLSLHNDYNNDTSHLYAALTECRLDDIIKILCNGTIVKDIQ